MTQSSARELTEFDEGYEGAERIVHARYNGVEVVRYGDEWFLEPSTFKDTYDYEYYSRSIVREKPEPPLKEKQQVSLEEAAENAAKGVWHSWQPENRCSFGSDFRVYWGQEGGEEFEKLVRRLRPNIYTEIEYADLGDGHKVMVMRCPGCQEWMHINDTQLSGKTCTDHQHVDGGCGFHGYTIGKNAGYVCDLGDVLNKKKKLEKEAAVKKNEHKALNNIS